MTRRKIACPAAHRARTNLIESRDLAMRAARAVRLQGTTGEYAVLLARCVRAARDCQHEALRWARQDRS